jgi:hypothetical protein
MHTEMGSFVTVRNLGHSTPEVSHKNFELFVASGIPLHVNARSG